MVRYIIQCYERYAIHEPAEGGYYYEGMEPLDDCAIYETKQEAIDGLKHLVSDENKGLTEKDEGFLFYHENDHGVWAESGNHRYIGDGYEYYVEPINRRGRKRKGKVPYC